MIKDEAIEEIRAVRKKISEQYGHDISAFLNHYKKLELKYKDKILKKPSLKPAIEGVPAQIPNEQAGVTKRCFSKD